MRHFIHLDLHSRRIISLNLPSLGTHVANAQQGHCAIAFTHDNTMVTVTLCKAGINGKIRFRQRVRVVTIIVRPFRVFADACAPKKVSVLRCAIRDGYSGLVTHHRNNRS
jgi:hypothetical protein